LPPSVRGWQKTRSKIEDWLLRQDAYILHKLARRIPTNPFTVNNAGDLWVLDLADMCSLASHRQAQIPLNVTDAFSKYAYSVPICCKTGEAVALTFQSLLARNGGRQLAVPTNKCKEFLNVTFRKLVDGDGIEMSVYRNPTVKCAIVELFNRTLKSKVYKWIMRNNT
jgi:hypothetical protein